MKNQRTSTLNVRRMAALCAVLTLVASISAFAQTQPAPVQALPQPAAPTATTPTPPVSVPQNPPAQAPKVQAPDVNVKDTLDNAKDKAKQAAKDMTKEVKSDPWRWGHIIAAGLVVVGLLFADVLRPGSLERAGKRDVSVFGAHVWFLCALLVLGIQLVASGFTTLLPSAWMGATDSLQHKGVVQLVVYGVSLVCACLLVRLISASATNGGLKFTGRSGAWGTLAFILAWPVVIASSFLWTYIEQRWHDTVPQHIAHDTLQLLVDNRSNPWAWTIGALAIIGAPIVEEVVYRGFLQSAILRATNSPWISILVTSALFAGVHLIGTQPVPWYAAATIGVLGLCMGVAFERTKEIGVPITMHILFNLANVALALWTQKA